MPPINYGDELYVTDVGVGMQRTRAWRSAPRSEYERDFTLPDLSFSYLTPLLHTLLSPTEVQLGK